MPSSLRIKLEGQFSFSSLSIRNLKTVAKSDKNKLEPAIYNTYDSRERNWPAETSEVALPAALPTSPNTPTALCIGSTTATCFSFKTNERLFVPWKKRSKHWLHYLTWWIHPKDVDQ